MSQTNSYRNILEQQQVFFASGQTRSLDFRLAQLRRLKDAVQKHEPALLEALRLDLGKGEFEAYASEIGFIYEEIRHTVAHLAKWMKPVKVKTPLLYMPSRSEIIHEPKGSVLIIAPWNYPVQLLLTPLIGAIAAGNCSVLKPSEVVQHTEKALVKLINETFKPEYCAVIEGGVPETTALLKERFDHIFFTGSTPVGRIVMRAAAEYLTPVTLELGGKSPCIVDKHVNLDVAAKRIVWSKFYNAGQTCVAPDYLLVQHEIKAALLQKLGEAVTAFFGADPKQSPDYARIVNDRHFERLTGLLNEGRVTTGGQTDKASRYIAPTIIDDVKLSHKVMADEIFGPILPVLSFGHLDEALAVVAQRPRPLACYVFTSDNKTEERVLRDIAFGGGCVNNALVHLANLDLPFGGIGESGMGAYHGEHSFHTFSHRKAILKTSTLIDPALKYPPYGNRVGLLRRLMR